MFSLQKETRFPGKYVSQRPAGRTIWILSRKERDAERGGGCHDDMLGEGCAVQAVAAAHARKLCLSWSTLF